MIINTFIEYLEITEKDFVQKINCSLTYEIKPKGLSMG